MLQDRRRETRRWVEEAGKVFTSTSPVTPCTVIEISDHGARLSFGATPPEADNLLLIMEALGEVRIGVVRWRLGTILGIEYVRDPDDLLD